MDPLLSQFYFETCSSGKPEIPSSGEDGMNVGYNEIFVTKLDQIVENPALLENDDAKGICLASQQYMFKEIDQGNSQKTENITDFTNLSHSNENAVFKSTSDSRFILLQQENSHGSENSDYLLGVPKYPTAGEDLKITESGNLSFSNMNPSNENLAFNSALYSYFILLQQENDFCTETSTYFAGVPTNVSDGEELNVSESKYELESNVTKSERKKSKICDYIETFMSNLYPQNEIQSSYTTNSNVRVPESNDSSRTELSLDAVCMSESFEGSEKGIFSDCTYIPAATDITGICDFFSGQKYVNAQDLLKNYETHNEILPGKTFQACGTRNEFSNSDELPTSINNTEAVAGPSKVKVKPQYRFKDGRFICFECGKGFRHKSGLRVHYKTHTGQKNHVCDKCGKRFVSNCHLITHTRFHIGERPYSCDRCEKIFFTKGHLIVHLRTHTGEKTYSCDKCEYKCNNKWDLKKHELTHTGEKPYKCDICEKAFAQGSNLNSHRKNLHSRK